MPPFYDTVEINIETIVEQVIADNQSNGKLPQCDLHDIIRAIVPGITAEMRRLVKSGKYTGSITINKIPVLRRKD